MSNLDIQRVELGEGHGPLADHLAAVGAVALDEHVAVVVLVAAAPSGIRGCLAAASLGARRGGVGHGGPERRGRAVAPRLHLEARLPALLVFQVPPGHALAEWGAGVWVIRGLSVEALGDPPGWHADDLGQVAGRGRMSSIAVMMGSMVSRRSRSAWMTVCCTWMTSANSSITAPRRAISACAASSDAL